MIEFVYYREETRTNIDEQQYDGPAGMVPDGVIESTYNEIVLNFDDMNLKEELLRGIYAYGFEKPSAIQQRAILPCIRERDVIAQAQSGKFNIYFHLRRWKFSRIVLSFNSCYFWHSMINFSE